MQVSIKRRQLPFATVKAGTIHSLQGETVEPGLIFHWVFPTTVRKDLRWLAAYVALSRVRCLADFKSVGLTNKIRTLLEEGPPETLPKAFATYFAEKEVLTQQQADAAMQKLGWHLLI